MKLLSKLISEGKGKKIVIKNNINEEIIINQIIIKTNLSNVKLEVAFGYNFTKKTNTALLDSTNYELLYIHPREALDIKINLY